eukprot:19369-Heterococcus_DN1.PRE.3
MAAAEQERFRSAHTKNSAEQSPPVKAAQSKSGRPMRPRLLEHKPNKKRSSPMDVLNSSSSSS